MLRIAAYVPQMLRLTRHPDAVPSFTYVTWTLFAAANFSTTAYVQLVLAGPVLAAADDLAPLAVAR